jgi:hypothetical protein
MKAKGIPLGVLSVLIPLSVLARPEETPTGQFTATAEVSTSQGSRSMVFQIVVSRPLSIGDALPFRHALETGGQQGLLALLRSNGSGQFLLGAVEYPINLIVAEPVKDGYRYIVVTARNFTYEEVNEGRPSMDFPFAVAVFQAPEFGTGDGTIYPKAALSIDAEGHVKAEPFEGRTGRLKEVRRR